VCGSLLGLELGRRGLWLGGLWSWLSISGVRGPRRRVLNRRVWWFWRCAAQDSSHNSHILDVDVREKERTREVFLYRRVLAAARWRHQNQLARASARIGKTEGMSAAAEPLLVSLRAWGHATASLQVWLGFAACATLLLRFPVTKESASEDSGRGNLDAVNLFAHTFDWLLMYD
jgi:hypothetical protein